MVYNFGFISAKTSDTGAITYALTTRAERCAYMKFKFLIGPMMVGRRHPGKYLPPWDIGDEEELENPDTTWEKQKESLRADIIRIVARRKKAEPAANY